MVGMTLPTVHAILCKHFDRCAYDPASLPNIILANAEAVKVGVADESVQTWLLCSDARHIHPAMHAQGSDEARPVRNDWGACMSTTPITLRNASSLVGKVVFLETAFMLFHPGCASGSLADCKPWDYTHYADKVDVYGSWRNYLGACLGYDVASHGPKNKLNVLVVDRDYWVGRHILNIHEMLRNLRERYPVANVTSFYPERYSLADQVCGCGLAGDGNFYHTQHSTACVYTAYHHP